MLLFRLPIFHYLTKLLARRAKAYGKQTNANNDDLATTGSLIRISTTGESIGLDAIGVGWSRLSEATKQRGSATTYGEKKAGIRGRWEVIDIYTVSKWYGEPIIKQSAKKCTGKTVTFLDGRREGMQNEFRQHFTNLSDAIEFFERSQAENKARFEAELNTLRERDATFYAFVAGERGEE